MTVDKNGNKGTTSSTSEDADEEGEGEEEEEEEEEDETKPELPSVIPPDGGFGWVIVFIGFMGGAIVDGIIFSFGIVFAELLVAFDESSSKTAWIGSSMAGMYLIIGPVVSALANRYGCRLMAIVGAFIGSVALAASVFAPNVNFLIFTYGIIGGIGFGFIYLPCIVMVQFYFDKKRAFATGISVCGSGMGAFIFAPLSSFLIGEYGWRGNMLIQSAIVLHMVALGMLLRPLTLPKAAIAAPPTPPAVMKSSLKPTLPASSSNGGMQKSLSTQSFRTYENGHSTENKSEKEMTIPALTIEEAAEKKSLEMIDNNEVNEADYLSEQEKIRQEALVKLLNRRKSLPVNINQDATRPFYRQDIFFSGSLMRIPQYSSHGSLQHYRCSVVSIPKEAQKRLKYNSNKWRRWLCPKTIRHTISTMLDFSLLKSVTFLVLCAASFITMTGFFIPFIYLAAFAAEVGISKEDAAFLFSVIGIANTVGRVFSGWVSDRPNVNALFITNVALTTGGLATALVPFLRSYQLLLAYSAVFGLAIVELLGLEKLTNAFGLLLLFQGIASMIGSPMAGFFYDKTLSYDASFFIAGGLIALSGLLGFPLPYISSWENRRAKSPPSAA